MTPPAAPDPTADRPVNPGTRSGGAATPRPASSHRSSSKTAHTAAVAAHPPVGAAGSTTTSTRPIGPTVTYQMGTPVRAHRRDHPLLVCRRALTGHATQWTTVVTPGELASGHGRGPPRDMQQIQQLRPDQRRERPSCCFTTNDHHDRSHVITRAAPLRQPPLRPPVQPEHQLTGGLIDQFHPPHIRGPKKKKNPPQPTDPTSPPGNRPSPHPTTPRNA